MLTYALIQILAMMTFLHVYFSARHGVINSS